MRAVHEGRFVALGHAPLSVQGWGHPNPFWIGLLMTSSSVCPVSLVSISDYNPKTGTKVRHSGGASEPSQLSLEHRGRPSPDRTTAPSEPTSPSEQSEEAHRRPGMSAFHSSSGVTSR